MCSKHYFNYFNLAVTAAVILTLALASPAAAQQRRASAQVGANCSGGFGALFDEIEATFLSEAEEIEVVFLREEEKLARDVYIMLFDTWQLPIFSNIAQAEQRHMDAVLLLLDTYGVADPVVDDTVGAFVNLELADLYTKLVEDGRVSLIDALIVGATIEDLDIADLYHLLGFAVNDHVKLVANNLAKGSRNHLRVFMRALKAQDATYTPQFLDQDVFDEILASEMERGVVYGADGEPIAECGGAIGGIGMRRGISGNGGNDGNSGNHGQNNGSGSGTGECDGTGSTDGGNGSGTGECDGSGSTGGSNGNGNGGGN